MNKKQKKVLWIGVILIALLSLPYFSQVFLGGYHGISSLEIGMVWAGVIIIVIGLLVFFKNGKQTSTDSDARPTTVISDSHPNKPSWTSQEDIPLDNETKKCPACAEIIKFEAKKCRFCGEELDPDEVDKQVKARKAELWEEFMGFEAQMKREGKTKCPQCENWDARWAYIEDGSHGHWCPHCKKSLKAMGFV